MSVEYTVTTKDGAERTNTPLPKKVDYKNE